MSESLVKIKRPGFTTYVAKDGDKVDKWYETDPEPLKRLMERRQVSNRHAEYWPEFSLDAASMHEVRKLGLDPFSSDDQVIDAIKKWVREHKPHLIRSPVKFYFQGAKLK